MLNPTKLIHATGELIARSELLRRRVVFTVIGGGNDDYAARLERLVASTGTQEVVRLLGRRSDEELRQELIASDVVINLRNPHTGESSASLLDSLFAGVATVVWDHGSYGEFPDEAVCKVASREGLLGALETLTADAGRREALGRAAAAHARARFRTDAYCDGLRAFLERVRRQAVGFRLTDEVSDCLRELDLAPEDRLVRRLAGEISIFMNPEAA
jgi:glycosyltransferase involved in cell wall biosynthesis